MSKEETRTQNIRKKDCKENIWTRKRRRMPENKKKKEIKDILQGADIMKFIKSLRLRWYGHF